jgi:hypothetical protein
MVFHLILDISTINLYENGLMIIPQLGTPSFDHDTYGLRGVLQSRKTAKSSKGDLCDHFSGETNGGFWCFQGKKRTFLKQNALDATKTGWWF